MGEKRRVTMRGIAVSIGADGSVTSVVHEATDYVPVEILAAYVADAETRWSSVTVSDEPDAGPAGDQGDTHIPAHLKD